MMSLTKRLPKRAVAVMDIINSERVYVDSLECFIAVYIKRIEDYAAGWAWAWKIAIFIEVAELNFSQQFGNILTTWHQKSTDEYYYCYFLAVSLCELLLSETFHLL